jgi:hypothetical protein
MSRLEAKVNAILAEYEALRNEIAERVKRGLTHRLAAITVSGAIISFAVTTATGARELSPMWALYVVVPLLFVLNLLHHSNGAHYSQISLYISGTLSAAYLEAMREMPTNDADAGVPGMGCI